MVLHLVKKFLVIYGIRSSIAVFTRARHRSIFLSDESNPHHHIFPPIYDQVSQVGFFIRFSELNLVCSNIFHLKVSSRRIQKITSVAKPRQFHSHRRKPKQIERFCESTNARSYVRKATTLLLYGAGKFKSRQTFLIRICRGMILQTLWKFGNRDLCRRRILRTGDGEMLTVGQTALSADYFQTTEFLQTHYPPAFWKEIFSK